MADKEAVRLAERIVRGAFGDLVGVSTGSILESSSVLMPPYIVTRMSPMSCSTRDA